jgi:hypothetical protein
VNHHRSIRRWLQFGILDLLIVTTIVAIAVVLGQPVNAQASKAAARLFGTWSDGRSALFLSPDGCYVYNLTGNLKDTIEGVGWTISQAGNIEDASALTCGELRLLVRSEWGSNVMEVLGEGGQVRSQYERTMRLEGPLRNGVPHGTWSMLGVRRAPLMLEYDSGELVNCHDSTGWRDLATLNGLRSGRGLPPLGPGDFASTATGNPADAAP